MPLCHGLQARQRRLVARHARGFTLIELMVTMVLVAVLLRIGIPSFVSFQRNSELTSAANGLLSSVNSARTEAMKRNMNAGVVPASGSSWAGGGLHSWMSMAMVPSMRPRTSCCPPSRRWHRIFP
nr:GspH/FimT family pseudopilin [Paracidovorax avenae]